MFLLDTNVLSELMRAEPCQAVVEWLDAQPENQLSISAVTRAEIELGIALLPEGKRRNALYAAALDMFLEFDGRCLPFDEQAAIHYARLVSRRLAAGRPISVEDAQIASIAIVHSCSVVTRNTADFDGIDNLDIINPWLLK